MKIFNVERGVARGHGKSDRPRSHVLGMAAHEIALNSYVMSKARGRPAQRRIAAFLDAFAGNATVPPELIFEWLPWTLNHWIGEYQEPSNDPSPRLNIVRTISKGILEGLEFLHSRAVRVTHCDLKPENILSGDLHSSNWKLADFGLADGPVKTEYGATKSGRGTMSYSPPGQMADLSPARDMWGFGCTLYEYDDDPAYFTMFSMLTESFARMVTSSRLFKLRRGAPFTQRDANSMVQVSRGSLDEGSR